VARPSLLACLLLLFFIYKGVLFLFSQATGQLLSVSFPKEHTPVCSCPASPFLHCSSWYWPSAREEGASHSYSCAVQDGPK